MSSDDPRDTLVRDRSTLVYLRVRNPCLFEIETHWCFSEHCLVGLVVKASASRVDDPGFESSLCRDFSRSSHTSDLKIGTPVAALPGAWR